MEVTAESFLADCVRRRLLSGVPISPPERERFGAVLAFVDISGFSKLSEHLQVPPPMLVGSARMRRHGLIASANPAPSPDPTIHPNHHSDRASGWPPAFLAPPRLCVL